MYTPLSVQHVTMGLKVPHMLTLQFKKEIILLFPYSWVIRSNILSIFPPFLGDNIKSDFLTESAYFSSRICHSTTS